MTMDDNNNSPKDKEKPAKETKENLFRQGVEIKKLPNSSPKNESEPGSAMHKTTTTCTTEKEKDPKIAALPAYMQNQVRSLEGLSFYHGMMARIETEKLITRPGDFLLRATDNRVGVFEFILSFYNNRRLFSHFTILSDPQVNLWWLMVDGSKKFASVPLLVEYYQKNDMGGNFKLKRGIPKGRHMISHKRITYDVQKDLLGTGNFSEVYRGMLELENCKVQVALKNSKQVDDNCDEKTNKNAMKAKMEMIKEAYTMSQLRHPNSTQFFGIAIDRLPVLVVVEFCQGGSLISHILKNYAKIRYAEHLLYISDMLAGLAYIHSMSVLHRDLACRNVLISSTGFIKLSDFGLGSRSRRFDKEYMPSGDKLHCPSRWMAPESLEKKRHWFNRQTDVYSMGITIWEMFSNGVKPYQELDNHEAKFATINGKVPALPAGCGTFIETLYAKMTALEPNVRITSEMAHQTFQEYVQRDNLLTLNNLALNELSGVRRERIYHEGTYVPQVVVFNDKNENMGYQDAPEEMLALPKK